MFRVQIKKVILMNTHIKYIQALKKNQEKAIIEEQEIFTTARLQLFIFAHSWRLWEKTAEKECFSIYFTNVLIWKNKTSFSIFLNYMHVTQVQVGARQLYRQWYSRLLLIQSK